MESITPTICIQVNGEAKHAPPDCTLTALLKWLEVPLERVAVELNKAIVRKRDWESTRIEEGAQLEIVEFVGGG